MNRCLHVTIHENAQALPNRATAHLPSRDGSDPANQLVISQTDDPAAQVVISQTDDPPYATEPSFSYGGADGWGEATVQSYGCGCGASAGASSTIRTATPYPFIAPSDFSGFVIVRLAPGIDPNAPDLWELAGPLDEPRFPGLKTVLERPFKDAATKKAWWAPKKPRYLVSSPLVELKEGSVGGSQNGDCDPPLREKVLEGIRDLENQTALTAFRPLHSLTAYWRLDLREHPGLAEEVVAQLNLLAEVDLAYRELSANDPRDEAAGRLFTEDQGYLSDAPAGISASWAWQHLEDWPRARSLTICDLEQGWNLDHRYFSGENMPSGLIYGANQDREGIPGHHGTAVLGQLVAAARFKGAAPGLGRFVLASHYLSKNERDPEDPGQPHRFAGTNGHVAAALMQALNSGRLEKGDVLLLEVQRGLLPAEVDAADFDAIRLASGLGVLVVEAAGNGGFNLDAWSDPVARRSLRRGDPHFRDSGAVLVGAALASTSHDRAHFSNYGSRLDCFGWGEAVTTCGYGDLSGTAANDLFTNSFSGTSSASPIIAGAAALLQALYTKQIGLELDPWAMRALLADPATGTRQGPNVPGHIGVMPDLKAIVNGLQIVPVVYMRRSVRDDGSTPGPDDEISSSPDIFLWKGSLNNRYGEGGGWENLPAPGIPITTEGLQDNVNNRLYVRLRNRGLYEGGARIRLFASPAATFITPEQWIPWGVLDVVDPPGSTTGIIPQGDTLFVAGPVTPVFELNDAHTNTLWSFLAVLSPPVESCPSSYSNFVNWMAELPPGSPYFDWAQYRAFLRQPGVAWRNTHRVAVTTERQDQDLYLPFSIAGTQDRARLFDFEVIQRLPEGATVTLSARADLEAKLRQRQPCLGSGLLPKRPRLGIRGVSLAPGKPDKASFRVHADSNTLTGSHSLAIRQLWHGEEVGRITWYFGLDS